MNLATTRKGTTGEAIARDYFIEQGYQPYAPDFEGSHPVDFLIRNPIKRTFTAVEVKTYARRYVAPQNGLHRNDLESYQAFESKEGIKVYLIFVDPFEGAMYGAFLTDLREPDATTKGRVYFNLERFRLLKRLTAKEQRALPPSPVKSKYKRVVPFFKQVELTTGK